MSTFEVCLKIPDIHKISQQDSAKFYFNKLLCDYDITRYDLNFNKLTITITGNVDFYILEECFLRIYEILFFNYGYFPKIISTFKPQLSYYTSAEANHAGFFRKFPPFFLDLNRILNEKTLNSMVSLCTNSNVKMEPILRGFFYLFSHDYVNVLIEHKVTLLFHIFEGYGHSLHSCKNIDYASRHILQECYTEKSQTTKHEIFINDTTKDSIKKTIQPLLKNILSKHDINKELLGIRNYYSHLYEKSSSKDGKILFSLFLLISLSIRIRFANDIITPHHFTSIENESIKECFFIIADYVHKIILETPSYKYQSVEYDWIETLEMIRKACAS